ncbi:MAG: aminotransferase class I/II-fold pyridoxal phosphate-dependent enzyme [Desulfobacterales bacterium]|nr:aminotransferase class I/II-fold pyridoxal phosphate-dependent enzyme [Desulfobacterales bacterium]
MKIQPFALERYFARHEFSARHLLSSSDCESLTMAQLLRTADPETMALWENLKLGYTETPGHPALREAVAEIYDGLTADDILVVVPEEGIFLLMNALLRPGDHVVCAFPGYQSLYEIARSIGCTVDTWQPDEDRGWHFDVGDLERKLRPDTRLIVVNFPHNPTGFLPAFGDYAEVIELARSRGAYLFSDEMYRYLEVDKADTLHSACELYGRAFSLFGLSKSFGVPGLRVGWVASRDRDGLDRMSMLKDYTTICASAPSEILAIMALKSRKSIISGHRERLLNNLAVLDRFFAEYPDCFQWVRPKGGSICFPRLKIDQGAEAFCDTLVEKTGIMLVPSTLFGYGDTHVRIGFGRENLPDVIDRFAGYLDATFRSGKS